MEQREEARIRQEVEELNRQYRLELEAKRAKESLMAKQALQSSESQMI
jgi:hypothetical protein